MVLMAQVKEKMVMLLDARARLHDPNAMDIGEVKNSTCCVCSSFSSLPQHVTGHPLMRSQLSCSICSCCVGADLSCSSSFV